MTRDGFGYDSKTISRITVDRANRLPPGDLPIYLTASSIACANNKR